MHDKRSELTRAQTSKRAIFIQACPNVPIRRIVRRIIFNVDLETAGYVI